MFIIKVKGKVNIGDYIQLRDEKFTLLAYFRADHPDRALEKCGYGEKKEQIREVIKDLPYGKLLKLDV